MREYIFNEPETQLYKAILTLTCKKNYRTYSLKRVLISHSFKFEYHFFSFYVYFNVFTVKRQKNYWLRIFFAVYTSLHSTHMKVSAALLSAFKDCLIICCIISHGKWEEMEEVFEQQINTQTLKCTLKFESLNLSWCKSMN